MNVFNNAGYNVFFFLLLLAAILWPPSWILGSILVRSPLYLGELSPNFGGRLLCILRYVKKKKKNMQKANVINKR